ncbi:MULTISPECIES: conjugal transfer protein TrbL [Kocuria]|uniref:conjugal transfer protein TrbL n=1 Tax=Kocuria TaxID=57493 RepID=UPI0008A45DDD|nr:MULTISPECIES: conjugal transfer protein TrbL [Kocuria]OFK07117.1 conjugal transfer protein TrbL [Kocuria sp. HMSC066H03]PKZ38993.1 conjugal transfer protein TrbL [Kocuria rhizophila]
MGVCDIPVISTVCDTAGEAAASLISAPFDWLAQALGGAAGWLIETMWTVFDTTTLVDLTGDGYVSVYNLVFGIAVFVTLLFFCFQLILGLIRRDPGALTRAALGTGKAILGSFVVITLTTLALEIVDQLCIGIVQASGETTETMGDKIALLAAGLAGINISAPGVGAVISIFLAGLMIAAVAIVWFSLLIRKALILIVVILAPLAFSGSAWDISRSWVGKWAAFLLALIVSKLVLVLVFLIAITQMATPIEADLQAVTEPITGIVMLAIAAFAPYMVYRLISFLGFDIYNQMGTEQDAKQAMNRPVPMPNKPQGGQPKKVLDGDGGDGPSGGGSGGAGGGPPPPPPGGGAAPAAGAGAGAGAGGAAAAGPAAAVVLGAEVVKEAATAGPEAGAEIGGQAEAAADGANQNTPTSDGTGQAPPPATPAPSAPNPPPSGGPVNETPDYGKE